MTHDMSENACVLIRQWLALVRQRQTCTQHAFKCDVAMAGRTLCDLCSECVLPKHNKMASQTAVQHAFKFDVAMAGRALSDLCAEQHKKMALQTAVQLAAVWCLPARKL